MSKYLPIPLVLLLALAMPLMAEDVAPVHMANGIKIGEVSSTSAIIWTRLTKHAERNVDGKPFPKRDKKEGKSEPHDDLEAMEGSVPGRSGEVRITYWPVDDEVKKSTEWIRVDDHGDFTRQVTVTDLLPGTRYGLLVEGRPGESASTSCKVVGSFFTAPAAGTVAPVRFMVVTCQEYPRRDSPDGHRIYQSMLKLKPDFFVHTGDIEYYDKPGPYAKTLELARFKWNRIFSLPHQRTFHNHTASYFMKDDHDTLKNDCWPGQTYGALTWEQGLALFREQVPMGAKTYRTIRWGKDLQVWLVEGRDFRSPNTMPDGPEKTIWGGAQKEWFFETVKKSDATFRMLISPTPITGPDRGAKNDNHANKGFTHEGDELRSFIGKQKNMFVICGDRHWQYVSEDPGTGVREYACGSASDQHAGGFREKNRLPMHEYLKVKGGFLSVAIERTDDQVQAVMTHHAVDGTIYNQDIVKAE
jgi:alkaline phosphatase D